ncbi:hypothetical protein AAES_40586 [Amazona aestiva]|uniref:Serpin domain-containing protein n=1 Tax=Amazona aestiva TaxID=12930 RepID=A0A0Q3NE03_AMAAE|nr:hypothetical protein AAES_40586 [Amazona aestiva]
MPSLPPDQALQASPLAVEDDEGHPPVVHAGSHTSHHCPQLTETDHHNEEPNATDHQEEHPCERDSLEPCQQIAPSNTDFAFKSYREAAIQKPGKNIFFSSVSISTDFALLALGSRAISWTQVLEELAFNLSNT